MKTTKADFEEFKKWFLYYQDLFGLKNFDVTFLHKKVNGIYASCDVQGDTTAVVMLNNQTSKDDIGVPPMKELARHEAAHLLLGRLKKMACTRFMNPDEIDREEERVVTILEKVIP